MEARGSGGSLAIYVRKEAGGLERRIVENADMGKETGMKNSLPAILAIALLIFGHGCQRSEDTLTSPAPASSTPREAVNLDSPTGGFTASSEKPAFGEPDAIGALANESQVEDSCENDPGFQRMLRARGARLYDFRAVWGHLADASDTNAAKPCPLDWSGTLHLEGGIIAIEKVIGFEPTDSLWRVDKSTIQWVSRTGPRVDGIQVKLVVPPTNKDNATCVACEPKLVLRTGPYSRTFTLKELVSMNVVEPVDRCGNAISITSMLAIPQWPHGRLAGSWKMTPPDTLAPPDSNNTEGIVLGVFRGIWIAERGLIGGCLKGVYGLNSEGKKVFFGKYIDPDGRFMGILRGTYGVRPEVSENAARPHGWFAGEWVDENVNVKGKLKGHWIGERETGNGYFHGVWRMGPGDGTDGNNDGE